MIPLEFFQSFWMLMRMIWEKKGERTILRTSNEYKYQSNSHITYGVILLKNRATVVFSALTLKGSLVLVTTRGRDSTPDFKADLLVNCGLFKWRAIKRISDAIDASGSNWTSSWLEVLPEASWTFKMFSLLFFPFEFRKLVLQKSFLIQVLSRRLYHSLIVHLHHSSLIYCSL